MNAEWESFIKALQQRHPNDDEIPQSVFDALKVICRFIDPDGIIDISEGVLPGQFMQPQSEA